MAIPVPLRRDDPDVFLDLQPLVDEAYASGRYDRTVDYAKPCEPPLDPEDAAWAEELLKGSDRR